MTLEKAISIAHNDRDGAPLNPLRQPPPTPPEALEIIRSSLKTCGFNWLTGVAARDCLQEHIYNRLP